MPAVSRLRSKLQQEQAVETNENDSNQSFLPNKSNSTDSEDDKKKGVLLWWHFGLPENDRSHVLLLIVLYVLQGIPLGLTGSVPYILMSRHASYSELATFSFAFWPFSLKLFWAPLVDCLYSNRFGRRKSWLVPIQYMLGASMLWLSWHVTGWLGHPPLNESADKSQNASKESSNTTTTILLLPLTISFFWLNFLAATQDIVVDGWALTMLSRANVGWASTCNAVGQTLGYCIAFMLFLALESAEFCNRWLRSEPQPEGIITFSGFLFFWAIVFIITNTLVMLFKSENTSISNESNITVRIGDDSFKAPLITNQDEEDVNDEIEVVATENENIRGTSSSSGSNSNVINSNSANVNCDGESDDVDDLSEKLSLRECYRMLWRIVWLRPVQQYIFTLILVKAGLSASDSLTVLKLIERGVSKETLAFLSVFTIPIQLLLPLFLSRYVTGPRPFTVYMKAALPRTLYGIILAGFVYITPYFRLADKSFPIYYFVILVLISAVQQVLLYTMFVCQMAFQAKVSDPAVGGTYMTFMNTIANLSGNIPSTILMYLVDPLSKKYCEGGNSVHGKSCLGAELHDVCIKDNGECIIYIDGYYILSAICIIGGTVAILARKSVASQLENLSRRCWFVVPRNSYENRAAVVSDDNNLPLHPIT